MEIKDRRMISGKIFSTYTKEELKLLKEYIKKEYGTPSRMHWGTRIYDALNHCNCNPFQLSCYPFNEDTDIELFTIDMDQLPLYINDENKEKAAIAKWRLLLGRSPSE